MRGPIVALVSMLCSLPPGAALADDPFGGTFIGVHASWDFTNYYDEALGDRSRGDSGGLGLHASHSRMLGPHAVVVEGRGAPWAVARAVASVSFAWRARKRCTEFACSNPVWTSGQRSTSCGSIGESPCAHGWSLGGAVEVGDGGRYTFAELGYLRLARGGGHMGAWLRFDPVELVGGLRTAVTFWRGASGIGIAVNADVLFSLGRDRVGAIGLTFGYGLH